MSEIFVAGDIHGNYQGLMESLNAAGWQEGDTIICVGDVTAPKQSAQMALRCLSRHPKTTTARRTTRGAT